MANIPELLTGIGQAMKHLSERQRVISQNIANSDTPGFKARDVERPDFSALVEQHSGGSKIRKPQIEVSSTMAALGAQGGHAGNVVLDTNTSETKPDGNNVTLEDQMMKMAEVQADFTALTNLYRKQMSLLKIATGRGSGA